MTLALCFNCGGTKFGAICPCPECSVSSTGNIQLDIAFSDHRMSSKTLNAFGDVVRAIGEACDDDDLRFWSFIRFVSLHHSDILGINMDPEQQTECDAVLAKANPPSVVIADSERRRYGTLSERPDESDGGEQPDMP